MEKGIGGVSLRQIGLASGSANANVVGYHFGTKEALIEAILARYIPLIEAHRSSLLAHAASEGRDQELHTLLDALCRPIFEKKSASGRRRYAMLLWHLGATYWWSETSYVNSTPVTQDLLRRILAQVPQLSRERFLERMCAAGDMMTGALRRLDVQRLDDAKAEKVFVRTLRLGCHVLLLHG